MASVQNTGARLLRVGQASLEFGISPNLLRSLIAAKTVDAVRLNANGKWRVVRSSLERYLGLDKVEQCDSEKKVALYARRSGSNESDKQAIVRQLDDLRAFAKRLGYPPEQCVVYQELVSGVSASFKTRKSLGKLWADVREGKIGLVLVKDRSRLSRGSFGVTDLIEAYFSEKGVSVRYLLSSGESDDEDSDNATDMETLINVLTVFTNRASSKKSSYAREVHIPEETQKTLLSLFRQGVSIKALATYAAENNLRGVKNNGETVPLSRFVIYGCITANTDSRKGKKGNAVSTRMATVKAWFDERLELHAESWTKSVDLYGNYCEWAKGRGEVPVSSTVVGHYLTSMKRLPVRMKQIDGDHARRYQGVRLKS